MKYEEYFMGIAKAVAKKSKDPRTKVGAVLVDASNRIISTGYNGMPYGCKEDELWEDKYPFVIHAEMNAIMFAKQDLRGCRMYCTLSPCINCLKHALQAGIRVIYFEEHYSKFSLEELEQMSRLLIAAKGHMYEIPSNSSDA